MKIDSTFPEPQSAKFEGSFAWKTIKDRLPQILTKTIDSLHRQSAEIKKKHGDGGVDQLNNAIRRLSQLRCEIMTDEPLSELPADASKPDVELWNSWLRTRIEESKPTPFSWFKSPWLDVECFMYRVIHEAFRVQPLLKDIDPFGEAKLENLAASSQSVDALFTWYEQTMIGSGTHSAKSEDFDILLQLSLWGNRCDLSLSGGTQAAATASHIPPDEEVKLLKPFLLVDHSTAIWQWLSSSLDKAPHRVDIVLDNSGYELINDLILADWLLHQESSSSKPLFSPVVFHCKSYPWFVSDTTPEDFEFTLKWLGERSASSKLVKRLRTMMSNGRFLVQNDPFWNTPYHFWVMKEQAPELFKSLTSSRLVVFKGDLNGRKMFADLKWDPCAPLEKAFGPLIELFACSSTGSTALCLARTLKCEVGFGVSSEVAEKLKKEHPDWSYSGKFGEIQAAVPKRP